MEGFAPIREGGLLNLSGGYLEVTRTLERTQLMPAQCLPQLLSIQQDLTRQKVQLPGQVKAPTKHKA